MLLATISQITVLLLGSNVPLKRKLYLRQKIPVDLCEYLMHMGCMDYDYFVCFDMVNMRYVENFDLSAYSLDICGCDGGVDRKFDRGGKCSPSLTGNVTLI